MIQLDAIRPKNATALALLEVRKLSKFFYLHEREKKIQAFVDLSFSVNHGELLAITGPSGIGKSSILKCIYRSYLSDGGEIWYHHNGTRIDLLQCSDHEMVWLRQGEIGYVTQFLHCLPRKSALSVVAFPLLQMGVSVAQAEAKAAEMLNKFNLPEHLWDVSPHTFSGGEKQRVNLARGFVCEPKLLLVDEPTASLDPVTRDIVVNNIIELKGRGTTVVGVFHDPEIVERIADREFKLVSNAHGGALLTR